MRKESKQLQPTLVFERTKPVGEVRDRWSWTEATIWTERMLTTLETGVRGGKWFSLVDKAFSLRSLEASFTRVKANRGAPGVDGWTSERFEQHRAKNLERLHTELMTGTYRPSPVRRVWIPKPGTSERRPLGIPTIRDRTVQTALKAVLEPIFEKEFRDSSFGFRPGRSCRQALRKVWSALRNGKRYVVDADFRKFFDSIPHEVIMRALEEKVSDGRVLDLIRTYLKQGVMEGGLLRPDEEATEGTPQGSPLSPLLANIALHGLDVLIEESGYEIVRYADDFVILCQSREHAEAALEAARNWTARNGLSLHPDKTRIVDYQAGESFEFLGFEFKEDHILPRRKSILNIRRKIRERTPRQSGRSLEATIRSLNPVLKGWFAYFRDSLENVFREVDGFVRRRLRSMLNRRIHIRATHPGQAASKRWPNKFLADHGLYSMQDAWKESRSALRITTN